MDVTESQHQPERKQFEHLLDQLELLIPVGPEDDLDYDTFDVAQFVGGESTKEAPQTALPHREYITNLLQTDPALVLHRYRAQLDEESVEYFRSIRDPAIDFLLARPAKSQQNQHQPAHPIPSMAPVEAADPNSSNVPRRINRFNVFDPSQHASEALVRNRRYHYMNQVLVGSEYFSEDAMQGRQPTLFHQYIGQYRTHDEVDHQASEYAKFALSEQLMYQMDAQRNRTRESNRHRQNSLQRPHNPLGNLGSKKANQVDEDDEEEDDEDSDALESRESGEEEEDAAPSPSSKVDVEDLVARAVRAAKQDSTTERASIFAELNSHVLDGGLTSELKKHRVTESDRHTLREEFKRIMTLHFLSGSDVDFDYQAVDQNPDYDQNPDRIHDEEDAYFDDGDLEED